MFHAAALISVVLWQIFWIQRNIVGHTTASSCENFSTFQEITPSLTCRKIFTSRSRQSFKTYACVEVHMEFSDTHSIDNITIPANILMLYSDRYGKCHSKLFIYLSVLKAVCGSYSTAALRHIVILPEWVPLFFSRGAAHTKRRERPLLAKEGTIPGI